MAVNERGADGIGPEDASIAALYRHTAIEEPPRSLDVSVTAESRRAYDRPREPHATRWWPLWRVPFATAAVALVAVSLVALMIERKGATLEEDPPALRIPENGGLDPQRNLGLERAAPIESVPAREPRVPRAEMPRQREAKAKPAIESLSNGRRAEREEGSATTAPHENREARKDGVGEREGPSSVTERDAGKGMAQPDAVATPPGVVAAPPPSAPADTQSSTSGSSRSSQLPVPAAKPMAAPKAAPAAKREQTANPAAALIAELEGHAPPRWVDRILTLRREGRRAEADALLAELKRRYPDEPLPASLRQAE